MGDESKSREELLAELLFGYSAEDVTAGVAGLALFTEPDAARAERLLDDYVGASRRNAAPYVRTGKQELFEFTMRRKGGGVFSAETQSSFVLDDRGIPVRIRSLIRDISDRKAMERRLDELSVRDPLTGCYNRRHLERLRRSLERPTARWGCARRRAFPQPLRLQPRGRVSAGRGGDG